jgi:hypothetical protein
VSKDQHQAPRQLTMPETKRQNPLSKILRAYQRPNVRDMVMLAIAAVAILGLLPLTVYRTTVLGRGDAEVFFRAGWAVWAGYPLYQVIDHHGWSYHYPPTFALMMEPFARPMPGLLKPAWAMPYPVSLAVWYVLSVCALIWAMDILAKALTRYSGAIQFPIEDSSYWALRLLPPLALAPFVAASWMRGQPTTILILLIVMFLVFLSDGRRFAASAALSFAIAIKMFPAVFLLIPLLRRDVRTIAYTLLSTTILLFALPFVCLGLDATVDLYAALWGERLQGLATGHLNPRIESELSPWLADMVSVGAMLARVFGQRIAEAPNRLPAWAGYAQYVFDLLIVVLIAGVGYRRFWRARGPQPNSPNAILLAGAILFAALPAMLPVARPHYWAQEIPLVAILLVEHWRRARSVKLDVAPIAWTSAAFLAFVATGPDAPGILARLGPTTIVILMPVIAGLNCLRRVAAYDTVPPPARGPIENEIVWSEDPDSSLSAGIVKGSGYPGTHRDAL